MILPFSTKMNGKPTYFVEKIQKGIRERLSMLVTFKPKNYSYQAFLDCYPKLHSIREDKSDRWQLGNKIDFFINCRQKDMFRFAPVLPVVSIQNIEIIYKQPSVFFVQTYPADVYVDKRRIELNEIAKFVRNDGFDTIEDFFAYFNEDFKGKIIHWTDLRY